MTSVKNARHIQKNFIASSNVFKLFRSLLLDSLFNITLPHIFLNSKYCRIKKYYFVDISRFCKMWIKGYVQDSQKILPFLVWILLCWLCICHYEFEDSISNIYIDDINGSRCSERYKNVFLLWIRRFDKQYLHWHVIGFRRCKHYVLLFYFMLHNF